MVDRVLIDFPILQDLSERKIQRYVPLLSFPIIGEHRLRKDGPPAVNKKAGEQLNGGGREIFVPPTGHIPLVGWKGAFEIEINSLQTDASSFK